MVRLAAARMRAFVVQRPRLHALSAERQLLLLLTIHVLLWTWIGWSSRSNLDAAGDMAEAYAWSQGWQWGYHKHPPLSAWVVGLWFSVVPESQLGYSALSALNAAVGLAGLALLAREFLPRHWVLLCVAAASLTPGITTLAMRFNAHAVLISTWPWAMALFVRLMQHNRRLDALLCGLVCALALLGKYYSAVLLCTLLACSAIVPAWRQRCDRLQHGLRIVHLAPIDGHQDIAWPHPGLVGRTASHHTGNQGSVGRRQAERVRQIGGNGLHLDADPASRHRAGLDDLLHDVAGQRNGNREAYAQ